MSYRLRHGLIVVLLVGMATSNLAPVLWPGAGQLYRTLGLRQFWSMFAPNTVHDARFVEGWSIAPDGTRTDLGISAEPPREGWFWEWGYDRIHKLHKQVALHPDRYAAAYAAALCRVHALDGQVVELVTVHRTAPKPAAAATGATATRSLTPLGVWPCP